MEKPLTATGYAVLGLLAVRPWTTYELAKQVQRGLGWFWPRAERKLYDVPPELVARGLATVTEGHTGRRARSVYRITPAGRRALRTWLGLPSQPPTLEFEAMVKVFFADSGSLEDLHRTLESVAHAAEERRLELIEMIEATTTRRRSSGGVSTSTPSPCASISTTRRCSHAGPRGRDPSPSRGPLLTTRGAGAGVTPCQWIDVMLRTSASAAPTRTVRATSPPAANEIQQL